MVYTMKKKMLSAAIALVMAVSLVLVPDGAAVFTAGAVVSSDDWKYDINSDGTVMIKKYQGAGSPISITVPDTIDGRRVTGVSGTHTVSGNNQSWERVFGNVSFVTFSSSVTYVGGLVINRSVETVTFESRTPPTFASNVFEEGCPKTIYVPIGTESAYKKVLSEIPGTQNVEIVSIKSTNAFIIIGAGTLIGVVALIIAIIIIRKKKKPQP